jgi:hypothetical protein
VAVGRGGHGIDGVSIQPDGSGCVIPDSLGFAIIGDEGVEVAIPVHVSQGDVPAPAPAKGGGAGMGAERPVPVVEIHLLGLTKVIGDDGVEIAVAIHVSQSHGGAISPAKGGGDGMSTEYPTPVVEIHILGLVRIIGDEGI